MTSAKSKAPLHLATLPRNFATMICNHVFRHERDVNYVIHDKDGRLLLLCGASDHEQSASELKIVGFGHLLDRDHLLRELPPLPPGWSVERSDGADDWRVFEDPESDD